MKKSIILLLCSVFLSTVTSCGVSAQINDPIVVHFTVDGVEYQCEKDMTWDEWMKSSYNIDDFFTDIAIDFAHVLRDKYSMVARMKKGELDSVRNCDKIKEGAYYTIHGTWLTY